MSKASRLKEAQLTCQKHELLCLDNVTDTPEDQPETPSPPALCLCGLSAVGLILSKLSPYNPSCSIPKPFCLPQVHSNTNLVLRKIHIAQIPDYPTLTSNSSSDQRALWALPLSTHTPHRVCSVITAPSNQTATRIHTCLTQANISGGGES